MTPNLLTGTEHMELDVKLIQADIDRASRSVEFQWPGVSTAEDIAQDIWEHILESPSTKRDMMQMNPTSRYRTISKIGHRIANRSRTDYEHFTGNFKYSVDEVKKLLVEYMPEGPEVPAPAVPQSAMKLDLERGLFKLQDRYFDLIVRRYGEGEVITGGANKVALSRAVSNLTDLMNNSNKRQHAERLDGPGSRTVISNSTAYAISSAQYTGSHANPQRQAGI